MRDGFGGVWGAGKANFLLIAFASHTFEDDGVRVVVFGNSDYSICGTE